jgi:predicted metal-dependent hydrolase
LEIELIDKNGKGLLMIMSVKNVEKRYNGWDVCLQVELDGDELDKLKLEELMKVEEYQISQKGNITYFQAFMDLSEPWEDETLEELLKAIQKEVELKLLEFSD